MSDFDTFKSKPDRSDMDDTSCRYSGCDNEATQVLRCRNPKEWVPCCDEHAEKVEGKYGAKNAQKLL